MHHLIAVSNEDVQSFSTILMIAGGVLVVVGIIVWVVKKKRTP